MLNLYYKLPVFFQNLLITIYGYYWKQRRFGKRYKKNVQKWRDRDLFTESQWNDYQTKELRKLLLHAFDTVPFYTEKYKKHGFVRADFENFMLSDIKKLPFLEKEEYRKYGKTTLLSSKKEKGKYYYSSGSTGTPIAVYLSRNTHQKWSAAYEVRVRNWAKVNYRLSRGMIGGRKILKDQFSKAPFYRFNKAEKQLYFSAYHINENNIDDYLDGMSIYKIDYLVGYANSIYFLSQLILEKKLIAPHLMAVLVSSEKLTNQMRESIEKAFSCKVYDAYSGVEACGLISEDTFGDLLFSPDTGILEVLDNYKEVANGETGEVISTGFLNYDQPLIRYRIGDYVKKSKNQRKKSNKKMLKIDEISGRTEDVVVTTNGVKNVRFHSLFINISGLVLSQLIQQTLTDFTINLVVDKNYKRFNEKIIKERLVAIVGLVNEVKFNYRSELTKNNNGKIKFVISNVK
jgi:phenylacetate-CoA ligase